MDPNQTCEFLLNQIKASNLNYTLEETPFSVTLSLKKTFIKDKNGFVRSSGICVSNLQPNTSANSSTLNTPINNISKSAVKTSGTTPIKISNTSSSSESTTFKTTFIPTTQLMEAPTNLYMNTIISNQATVNKPRDCINKNSTKYESEQILFSPTKFVSSTTPTMLMDSKTTAGIGNAKLNSSMLTTKVLVNSQGNTCSQSLPIPLSSEVACDEKFCIKKSDKSIEPQVSFEPNNSTDNRFKALEDISEISSEAFDEVEVLDDKKRDENLYEREPLQDTQKTFMISEQQEAILE